MLRHSILLFTLLLGLCPFTIGAQEFTPEKLGLKSFAIDDPSMGTIHYYITANQFDKEKPVLLYLDGSGAYPLFQYTNRGIGSTVVIPYKELSERYHVVLISKPGVPFVDSMTMNDQTGIPDYKAPAEYTQRLSLDWRVNAADRVLNEVMRTVKVDTHKVVVLGISEGFQVGAKLITVNHAITRAVLFVGNGLSQLYDFIIQARMEVQSGAATEAEAQENIDSLMVTFKDIYANPLSTDKEWAGHTYLRWSSFSQHIPMESILSVNIPVSVIACAKDHNTAVLSTDYLYLESIRRHKSNLRYKVYPYDHSFNEVITDDKGKVVSVKNHVKEVISDEL